MDKTTIAPAGSPAESKGLDQLLWEVLWRPLGFPRNIRDSFKLEGESIEIVAKAGGKLVGGLVACRISPSEVEIRHIAVQAEYRERGLGRRLAAHLISMVTAQGCRRIRTIARNTSAGFFRKQGFTASADPPAGHPDFEKHGITFELMTKDLE